MIHRQGWLTRRRQIVANRKNTGRVANLSRSEYFANVLSRIEANDPDLTQLSLYQLGLSDDFIRMLVGSLLLHSISSDGGGGGRRMRNTHLRSLDVGGNDLSEVGAASLATLLTDDGRSCSVTTLWIRENRIGRGGIIPIADALKVNSTVTSLSLGGNGLTSDGAAHLASALRRNATLRRLWIYGNDIGNVGCAAILVALGANPKSNLEELYLGSNNITHVGAEAFASLLAPPVRSGMDSTANSSTAMKKKLAKLELYKNDIGDGGVAIFADLLRSPHSMLEELNLRSNNITYLGLRALVSAAITGERERGNGNVTCSILRKLDLRNNKLTTDEERHLLAEIGLQQPKVEIRLKSKSRLHSSSSHPPPQSASALAVQVQPQSTTARRDSVSSYADRSWPLQQVASSGMIGQVKAITAAGTELRRNSKVTWSSWKGEGGADNPDRKMAMPPGGSSEQRDDDKFWKDDIPIINPSLEKSGDYYEHTQMQYSLKGADRRDGPPSYSSGTTTSGLSEGKGRHPRLEIPHKTDSLARNGYGRQGNGKSGSYTAPVHVMSQNPPIRRSVVSQRVDWL